MDTCVSQSCTAVTGQRAGRLALGNAEPRASAPGIRLGPGDQEHEAVCCPGYVGHIQPDQLRPAQRTRKAEQEQGPVACPGQRGAARMGKLAHLRDGQRRQAPGWCAVGAPDPTQGFAGGRVLGIKRVPWDAAGASNGCHPAAQRRPGLAFAG